MRPEPVGGSGRIGMHKGVECRVVLRYDLVMTKSNSQSLADMFRVQSTGDLRRWHAEQLAWMNSHPGTDPAEVFALTAELERRSTEI